MKSKIVDKPDNVVSLSEARKLRVVRTDPEPETRTEEEDEYLTRAQSMLDDDNDVVVDDAENAVVSLADGEGAWVSAWVWVSAPDTTFQRTP